jgi:hypothetical protein
MATATALLLLATGAGCSALWDEVAAAGAGPPRSWGFTYDHFAPIAGSGGDSHGS